MRKRAKRFRSRLAEYDILRGDDISLRDFIDHLNTMDMNADKLLSLLWTAEDFDKFSAKAKRKVSNSLVEAKDALSDALIAAYDLQSQDWED